ncbi:HxlR family transcriptional regulator [Thalassotalea insulae]|uniref:HxlR family transcriptional regulator n=1 Tax=Thalassotalea insulae TaxID=2056778 RepID=A0ABQ6GMC6_9GAMM|nr:helix-turn-helix domain-containing protein [Thalassotalea insulae]GLX77006.1 HxlR family transcriptional regulator [Thalassotalea insulae]
MFDYDEACPISVATSILCEKWTLQIVRELFFGSTRYSEIQKYIPNLSPSLLRTRLRLLEAKGIIFRKPCTTGGHFEYHLTPAGKALAPVLNELGRWGMRYANEGMTDKQNATPSLLRDITGAINTDELPSGDTVIQIQLTDIEPDTKHYIYVRGDTATECSQNLGFDVDVYITATSKTLTKIWYGELGIHQALNKDLIKVVGHSVYTKSLSKWLGISSFTTNNPQPFKAC